MDSATNARSLATSAKEQSIINKFQPGATPLSDTTNENNGGLMSRLFKAIGPGLVTACVVIGPGSIMTSTKVGAADGFSYIWVVILSVIFMMVYSTLAMKLGIATKVSTCDLVDKHAGRWLTIILGFSIFFISATYQYGNNLGVYFALTGTLDKLIPLGFGWVIVFNGLAMLFLFGFKNLYSVLEKAMSVLVAMMLLAFAVNLIFAFSQSEEPVASGLAMGLNPFADIPETLRRFNPFAEHPDSEIPLLGLIGTTFVVAAAFYQTYLVRFKGWGEKDISRGLFDTRVGAIIMVLITLMIMCTAASVLRGETLTNPTQLAEQLEPLFGSTGQYIFYIGLFSAAFSSFIVNSMIGGFILSDSLNLGSSTDDRWTRLLTALVLLVGMVVAIFVIKMEVNTGKAIVFAQAITVIVAPIIAGVLLWLTNKKSIMGNHKNGPVLNFFAVLGLVVLLFISVIMIQHKVIPGIKKNFLNGAK